MIIIILSGFISAGFLLRGIIETLRYKDLQKDFEIANSEYQKIFGSSEKANQAFRKLKISLLELCLYYAMSAFFLFVIYQVIIFRLWK